ncbi:hypothetical protein FB99_02750 [Pantoea agglomerans]|nr:hypothetical protein FB99_02750 [Pantoea agglomerans]
MHCQLKAGQPEKVHKNPGAVAGGSVSFECSDGDLLAL